MSQAVANEDVSSPRHSYPWLMFTEAFRLAISPQCILLALVGALVVCCGWSLSDALFQPDESTAEFHSYVARWPGGGGPVEGEGLARFYAWAGRRKQSLEVGSPQLKNHN